ncbi:hypothetical protein WS91_25355 [Burkholderia sp. MSMB1498]|nr:hypothetical protein WS91_25355 [Burkholderia sp. MSMB1498]
MTQTPRVDIMDDHDEYQFSIGAYSPATIPMERLAKYIAALAKLFGNSPNVHLDRLQEGSTIPVMNVDRQAARHVSERISKIDKREAANDVIASYDELNALLRDDNATGELRRRSAGADSISVVLRFPGKELPKPLTFGPFTEPATIDGELVRIGGRDRSAHATMIDQEGHSWRCETTRELAQELAPYLYKGPVLRVHGDAKWERLEDGSWNLEHLKVTSFTVLDDDTLQETTDRLRQLHATDWSKLDDIDAYINASRGDNDGLH